VEFAVAAVQDRDARVAPERLAAVVADGQPGEQVIPDPDAPLPADVIEHLPAAVPDQADRRDAAVVERARLADVQYRRRRPRKNRKLPTLDGSALAAPYRLPSGASRVRTTPGPTQQSRPTVRLLLTAELTPRKQFSPTATYPEMTTCEERKQLSPTVLWCPTW